MSTDTPAPVEPEDAVPGATRPKQASVVSNAPASAGRHAIQSADLLGGATTVDIEHLGQTYRLQTTRAGKLILTK